MCSVECSRATVKCVAYAVASRGRSVSRKQGLKMWDAGAGEWGGSLSFWCFKHAEAL